jgi:catechol 2,3-dioxygenase-like lactoylglutathione lyase family enzyme
MTDAGAGKVDMKLEVITVPVSDIERAKEFYEGLGWRLDADFSDGAERAVQFTPPGSQCSIHLGKNAPGPAQGIFLIVSDIEAARDDLVRRGVEVSEVFHFAKAPFPFGGRVSGIAPGHISYGSYATFKDPDSNGWLLQEITTRLPGREWESTRIRAVEVATLAELLSETAEHHDRYEKTHAEHHWWDWYAPYLTARQNGSIPEEAAAAADRYMEEALHVLPR